MIPAQQVSLGHSLITQSPSQVSACGHRTGKSTVLRGRATRTTSEAAAHDPDPVLTVERKRGGGKEGGAERDVSPVPGNEVHVSQ